MIVRKTAIFSQNEHDNVRIEYGKIVKESVITKGNDVILNEVWNAHNIHKVTDRNLN